jgi:hypothetical protein
MDAAFTDEEEAFFREGDEMSLYAGVMGDSVPTPVIDLPSYRPRGVELVTEASDYYASYALSIEADEMSGLCEAA